GPAADMPAFRLTTYETAHLAGGEDAVLCAALASLVSRGALTISPRGRLERGPSADDARSLRTAERNVMDALAPGALVSLEDLRRAFLPPPGLPLRLKAEGLLVTGERAWLGWLAPLVLCASVPLTGALKLILGWSRNQALGWLCLACIATAVVTAGL